MNCLCFYHSAVLKQSTPQEKSFACNLQKPSTFFSQRSTPPPTHNPIHKNRIQSCIIPLASEVYLIWDVEVCQNHGSLSTMLCPLCYYQSFSTSTQRPGGATRSGDRQCLFSIAQAKTESAFSVRGSDCPSVRIRMLGNTIGKEVENVLVSVAAEQRMRSCWGSWSVLGRGLQVRGGRAIASQSGKYWSVIIMNGAKDETRNM